MRRDTPVHTFWAIIGMTLIALGITRYYGIPGDQAMPLFVFFMFLGIPIGEVLERWDDKRTL